MGVLIFKKYNAQNKAAPGALPAAHRGSYAQSVSKIIPVFCTVFYFMHNLHST